MTSNKLIAMLLVSVTMWSCQTVVDIDLPERDPSLCLNGLIQPDSTFRFTLSLSKGILEEGGLDYLLTGTITITAADGTTETITGTQNDSSTWYQSTMLADVRQSYIVSASADGYRSVVARLDFPTAVDIVSVDTGTIITAGYSEGTLTVTFDDPAEDSNYYELKLFAKVDYPSFDEDGNFIGFMSYVQEMYTWPSDDSPVSFGTTQGIFSDEVFNGQRYGIAVRYDKSVFTGNEGDTSDILQFLNTYLIAELRSVSRDYFLFQQSFATYEQSLFDPFSQPAPVYNNVEGGFGIVAGYSASRDTLQINEGLSFP